MNADEKLNAFEELLNEMSGGLADLVQTMKDRSGDGAMEEVSSTLVEMLAVMQKARTSVDLSEVVAAIKAIRMTAPSVQVAAPDVHVTHEVTVQPAQVQILERAPPREFSIHSLTYDRLGRLESGVISPVAMKL